MKTRFVLILIFLTGFFSFSSGQDFWEEVSIPDSVSPGFIKFGSQSEIYLSTDIGLYKSTDNGLTWNYLISYQSGLSVCISDNDFIYVGADNFGRIFYSDNFGGSWDTIYSSAVGGDLRLIGDSLLFIINWGNIYRSNNNGESWQHVLSTVNSERFKDLIIHNNLLFCGAIHFLDPSGGGLYRSTNFGLSWQQISLEGYGISSLELDSDQNLLAGINYHYYGAEFGILRTIDSGFNWNTLLDDHLITSLCVDEFGGIYGGCDSDFGPEGIKYSSDNGQEWISINSGLHDDAKIKQLIISPTDHIYTITESPSRIYRSVNQIVRIIDHNKSELKIHVYPNPFHESVMVYSQGHELKTIKTHFKIYSLEGVLIYCKTLNQSNGQKLRLNLAEREPGIYILSITNNQQSQSYVIVKL